MAWDSTGEKWKYRRRLLTPTFHFKILNDFLSIHQKHATKLVDLLQERVGKKEFNIVPYLSLCVLDIICETSMGIDIHAQFGQNSEYISSVFSICELIQERQKSPWLWPDFIYNLLYQGKLTKKYLDILHNFTNRVIDNRIEKRHEEKHSVSETTQYVTDSKRHILAFLDLLLEQYDEGNITREGISEEVDTFMFEGHDTTAASLQWVIHLIAIHPEVQQRLHKEVDDFFASVSDGGDISPDQLKNLIYVECAIKEALRLFPSVPLLGREVTHDCKLGEYDIPKGCNVFVAPMALHLHPNVWKDPLIFNPDRFLPGRNHGRNPFAYVPFSAGPRNCIGQKFALMEEKIVVAAILRHFKIFSTQKTQGIRKSPDIILNSADGVMITLERRETYEN
ncbi:cytochrome P450 4V2-like isoform X2 [Xenia sp. Carnegie-2017]|uniref:cytochrome P450 4V2-like isoform X2 n=1 Tax=Xenia sp. Carnegie-2017 TaxID=2897299 RepID=UPI001F045B46|nr:cytochrome P450 4V2-like isoform X2 [Xenia sp. Carnegie-2017]